MGSLIALGPPHLWGGGAEGAGRAGRFPGMARTTSTRWYIGAWIVWVAALIGFSIAYQHVDRSSPFWVGNPSLVGLGTIAQLSMLVMLGSWIGALIRLRRLRRWVWFAGVLIVQLIGLGILGMVAYAIAGPDDTALARPGVS